MIQACGEDLYSQLNPNVAEKAVKYLEKQEPDNAIDILLDELGENVTDLYKSFRRKNSSGAFILSSLDITSNLKNEVEKLINQGKSETTELISVLSAAHSQKYGVDPFDIALKLATSGGGESEGSAIMALYPALPDPTKGNKRGLTEAIAILNALSPSRLSSADSFKVSLLSMANMSLTTKALDTNPTDGTLSVEEILDLSADDAETILTLILTAAEASLNSALEEEGADADSSQIMAELKNQLQESSGASTTEQVQNFIIEASNLENPDTEDASIEDLPSEESIDDAISSQSL